MDSNQTPPFFVELQKVKGNEKDLDAHGNDHDNDGERAGCRLTENGTAAGSGG